MGLPGLLLTEGWMSLTIFTILYYPIIFKWLLRSFRTSFPICWLSLTIHTILSSLNLDIQIKLLSENKLIICAFGNSHYHISREKFEPEPGFEHRIFNGSAG